MYLLCPITLFKNLLRYNWNFSHLFTKTFNLLKKNNCDSLNIKLNENLSCVCLNVYWVWQILSRKHLPLSMLNFTEQNSNHPEGGSHLTKEGAFLKSYLFPPIVVLETFCGQYFIMSPCKCHVCMSIYEFYKHWLLGWSICPLQTPILLELSQFV